MEFIVTGYTSELIGLGLHVSGRDLFWCLPARQASVGQVVVP